MYPTPLRAVRLGVLFLLVAGLASAGNWDRFRGPNGSGNGGNAALPDTFTKDNVIWKVAVPGVGHSSPIVWGDKLFLQTSAPDGSSRELICFNALTGEKVWAEGIKGAKAHTHNLSSLASSTPTTDGERVYTIFWDGSKLHAHAYTMAGKEVWKKDLGNFLSDHGFGGSPIVVDGKLLLNNDQGKAEGDGSPADLIALDAKTGEQLWKQPHKAFRACSAVPVVNERTDGKKEVIIANTAGLAGYEVATGKELWKYTWKFAGGSNLRTVGSPILANGLVIANSGAGNGDRSVLAIKLGGNGDITEAGPVWQGGKTFPYVPTLLSRGDHVYYVADKNMVACVETNTGKEVFNERGSTAGFTASPVLVGDKFYTVDYAGDVRAFKAVPTYTPVGEKFSLGDKVTATPAVANDRLYIRTHNSLFCLGKR